MQGVCLIKFRCRRCRCVFAAWSDIAWHVDPYTREPIRCPRCGCSKLDEIETLEVG